LEGKGRLNKKTAYKFGERKKPGRRAPDFFNGGRMETGDSNGKISGGFGTGGGKAHKHGGDKAES